MCDKVRKNLMFVINRNMWIKESLTRTQMKQKKLRSILPLNGILKNKIFNCYLKTTHQF
jgi:hypothetical protein